MAEKLSAEDLKKIQDLNLEYNSLVQQVGTSEVKYRQLNKEISNLTKDKSTMIDSIEIILGKEKELAEEIKQKYGDIQFDINTGDII